MRYPLNSAALLAVALLPFSACGPRAAGVSGGESGGDLPPGCAPPNILCDGQCVDPTSDPEHCGYCGGGCRIYTPGQVASVGQCIDGLCEPSYVHGGCSTKETTSSCDGVCGGPTSSNVRCVPDACDGATIVWEAYYANPCDPIIDVDCPFPPDNTTECMSPPAEFAQYQSVPCDAPFIEAFAMAGLPDTPPVPSEGPYAGWIPRGWTARCCCQRLPRE